MRDRAYLFGILTRWVILTVSQASLLFLAAGTTQDLLLWTYLSVFSVLLLATMLIVNPGLAEERAHPGVPAISPGTRVATGVLFLVTLTAAALDSGRLQSGSIPAQLRIAALDLSRSARAFRPGRWPSILSSLRSFVSSRNEDIVP